MAEVRPGKAVDADRRSIQAFGEVLRGHRAAAGLTQEEVAERAGVSARSVGDIERGVSRVPQRHTVRLLADALALTGEARVTFELSAQRRRGSDPDADGPRIPRRLDVGQRPERMVARRHNLPAPHTPLIGREHDSATVMDLVMQAPGRMLTLTGTGGCGKTQLALLVASGLVAYAVAAVTGCRERAGEALIDTLVAHLNTSELLLVMDNCEHVIDACAELADRLLAGCPRVRLLATSRERLRIGAETTWRVPSLQSPDPRATLAPADLLAYPAVQLFVERARAAQPDFALHPSASSSMVGICARLEGLPLALELAAARVSALSLAQILERLDDSFRLLVGGSRTAPSRQHTLRATLDWSHALLSAAEQMVFRRLAVFGGGWSLEAAEAVCADPMLPATDVLEVLSHVVEKSLVVMAIDHPDGPARYCLLEPIRQYAREQLVASGEADCIAQRHAAFFLAFAETLERDASVGGARRSAAADALEAEYGNLQVALQRALDTRDAELGLRLAWTLQFVWKIRLPVGEGRPWVEAILALPGAAAPTPARAVSLLTAAWLAWERRDYPAADHYYAEADPLARRLGDPWILFVALADQGIDSRLRGDSQIARRFWGEGLEVTRASGDHASEAILLGNLGRLEIFEGNYAIGRVRLEKSLNIARQIRDDYALWNTLTMLALAALLYGDLLTARALAYESLNLHAHPTMRAGALHIVGQIAIAEGDYTAAREHLIEALALLANRGDPVSTAQVVEELGHLASRIGRPDAALRLAGAAEAAYETPDVLMTRATTILPDHPVSRDLRERWLIPLRDTAGADAAAHWWAEGRKLSLTEAIALAEATLAQTPTGSPLSAAGDPVSTPRPRQRDVSPGVGLSSAKLKF